MTLSSWLLSRSRARRWPVDANSLLRQFYAEEGRFHSTYHFNASRRPSSLNQAARPQPVFVGNPQPISQPRSPPSNVREKNEIGIQLLPRSLSNVVFAGVDRNNINSPTPHQRQVCQRHLERHELWNKKVPDIEPVHFNLPKLEGSNIAEHFYRLGQEQSQVYDELAWKLSQIPLESMPKRPEKWSQQPGWTRYDQNGVAQSVTSPEEVILVFDVEAIVSEDGGQYPAMATAMSDTCWYSWTSPDLLDGDKKLTTLIPLGEGSEKKLIVGHAVGYDRARVEEEYKFQGTQYGWLDTLSMHVAVGGLSNQQRTGWIKWKREQTLEQMKKEGQATAQSEETTNEDTSNNNDDTSNNNTDIHNIKVKDKTKGWLEVSAMAGLRHVVELYTGETISKEARELFVKGSRQDILTHFQEQMTYCALDVEYTFKVFRVLWPKFREKCPHPVSLAGMLHMARGYLTVSENWMDYLRVAEDTYRKNMDEIEQLLLALAEQALKKLDDESYKDDPWLKHLDWTIKEQRMTMPRYKKDGTYAKNGEPRPVKTRTILPDKPAWYRELWDRKEKRIKISTRTRVTPYLLKLQWRGYPIYFTKSFGWAFVVPKTESIKAVPDPLHFDTDEKSKSYDPVASFDTENNYYRIPHKDGDDVNCGDPLGKSYIIAYEKDLLSSAYQEAHRILQLNAECTYWTGSRQRIMEQFVVWDNDPERPLGLPRPTNRSNEIREENKLMWGVILPQSKVMGTVTRRAVEPTWMTASNAKSNRIGSELKSRVVSPPGYRIVGADVDSQELWIASLLGDSQLGIHGSTAFGWMNMQGSKADKSDLHSRTAQILGIARDNAKVFNYSRIYGAGVTHATQLLLQFNPGMERAEARRRAEELYRQTKGMQYRKRVGKYSRHFWFGGTESYMFNKLEEIAKSEDPRTPILSCQIPDSLKPQNAQEEFLTSRVNWVVQSSGVDYLHLLLVSMDYLIRKYGIKARFMLSIHDEIRFFVREDDIYRAALALQIANLWTRVMFSYRCGIYNLPLSVAFFSAVDIDHCLRKEVDMTCTTPSNIRPVEAGTNIDIYQLIKKLPELKPSPEAQEVKLPPLPNDFHESLIAKRPTQSEDDAWLEVQTADSTPQVRNIIARHFTRTINHEPQYGTVVLPRRKRT